MTFIISQIDTAIEIMREVASWLIQIGKPLWRLEDLTIDKMTETEKSENFIVGWENKESIAAMILKWHDPDYWPKIGPNESGFIHKLSVRRKWAGRGIAQKMIDYAITECKNRNISCLRLDCDIDRTKLISLYESLGFSKVNQKQIHEYTVALFEMEL